LTVSIVFVRTFIAASPFIAVATSKSVFVNDFKIIPRLAGVSFPTEIIFFYENHCFSFMPLYFG
jgi:hypothetical protein